MDQLVSVTYKDTHVALQITELERQTVEILDENDSVNTRAVSIVERFYTFSLEFRVFHFIVTKILRVSFFRELRHWHEIWFNIKRRDIPDGFLLDYSKRLDNNGPNVVEEFYHMAERSWTEMMKSPEQIFKISHSPDSQLGLYSLINIPVTTGSLPRQWKETLKGYLEPVPIEIFLALQELHFNSLMESKGNFYIVYGILSLCNENYDLSITNFGFQIKETTTPFEVHVKNIYSPDDYDENAQPIYFVKCNEQILINYRI